MQAEGLALPTGGFILPLCLSSYFPPKEDGVVGQGKCPVPPKITNFYPVLAPSRLIHSQFSILLCAVRAPALTEKRSGGEKAIKN